MNLPSFGIRGEQMIIESRRKISAAGVVLLLIAALLSGCRLYRLERKLSPPYADFLSKVRYIITAKERKIFLELPDAEKDAFIDEFWMRRDPDPDTAENEFKLEYFDRMEEAERLFIGEGRPGWLTDRGRIYILFGPPLDRIINPMARSETERCNEVWYYGDFPVVFRDQNCTGQFQLVTYDLTALRDINLMYMHELSLAQADAQRTFSRERALFDFDWRVRKTLVEPGKIEGAVIVSIPYSAIWLKEDEGRLKTDIEVELTLRDADQNTVWEHSETFEIALSEEGLKKKKRASFRREIPFVIEAGADRLTKGKNTLFIRLKNLTGDEELRKVMVVEF
jgi:GWxTD domain-containing protein